MKKIIILSIGIFYLVSCGDMLRIDEKQMLEDVTYKTSSKYLLSGSIDGVAEKYQSDGFRGDTYNAVVQYYQQLFHVKSQTYEEFAKAPADWSGEYNLAKSIRVGIDLAVEENQPFVQGALLILKSFVFANITDKWGDVPYSEALDGRAGIFFPKFDTQKEVYDGIMADLDQAISIIEANPAINEPKFDLLYAGSKEKWVKFANSLKIRLLVRSYEAYKKAGTDNGAKINAIVSSGKYFTSNADNASYSYLGSADYNSWPMGYFNDNSQNELTRRKPSTTFVEALKSMDDPRLDGWIAPALIPWANEAATVTVTDRYGYEYTVNKQDATADLDGDGKPDGEGNTDGYPVGDLYVGMPVGFAEGNPVRFGGTVPAAGAYDNYRTSTFGAVFWENSHELLKMTLLEASEVNLNLAEAVQRNWIAGNAKTFYDKGVSLSLERWGIPGTETEAYLSNPKVNLDGTNNLEKIATQKWLALFTVGVESYYEYRRTKLPSIIGNAVPTTLGNPFPERYRYPTAEKDNNTEKYDEAVARQGEDVQTTKIWLLK